MVAIHRRVWRVFHSISTRNEYSVVIMGVHNVTWEDLPLGISPVEILHGDPNKMEQLSLKGLKIPSAPNTKLGMGVIVTDDFSCYPYRFHRSTNTPSARLTLPPLKGLVEPRTVLLYETTPTNYRVSDTGTLIYSH